MIEVNGYEEHLRDPTRDAKAQKFLAIARGERTPIDLHREAWLNQLDVQRRTRADDERAFRWLTEWCEREKVPAFLQTLGVHEAVRFADDLRARNKTHSPGSLNKYIARLSLYWRWLMNRHLVSVDIWAGRRFKIPHRTRDDKERPFTDKEVITLLTGPTTQHMHDLMRIAALTGARLEAIVRLRVEHCRNDTFTFLPQKKEPGSRQVPIHPALKEIIERRIDGKQDSDDIFPEWPPAKKADSKRERSFKASNHFTDYRRSVGVNDIRPGNRRSRVNFHSFRRWFITKAEQAGQPVSTIQLVVGHKREGMTLGVYSGGATLEQLRECVEAVQLPTKKTD